MALDGASSVTVSPDGASAYAASRFSGAVAVFDRNTTTGALTQKAGTAGCISETGSAGACADGVGARRRVLGHRLPRRHQRLRRLLLQRRRRRLRPQHHHRRPDPEGGHRRLHLGDRHRRRLRRRGGARRRVLGHRLPRRCQRLRRLPGRRRRRIRPQHHDRRADPEGGHRRLHLGDRHRRRLRRRGGAHGANSVTVSPDGTSAYVASQSSDAVAVFDRNTTTGALTQKAGTAGCISETGTAGACADGVALNGASSVTVSPDGTSAYASSLVSDAVAVFDRNTTTGALTQKAGTAGCISETGTAGACADGVALDDPLSVTVSPDGTSAYVASFVSDAVAIFDRDVPPETMITSGPEGLTNDPTPSFTFTSSEPGSSFECRLDSGPFEVCTTPFTSFGLTDAPHRFQVRATDTTDNTDPTPAERSFTVDTALEGSTTAKKTQKQKGKKIVAKVKVTAGEDLDAEASGKVKVGKKSYKLKQVLQERWRRQEQDPEAEAEEVEGCEEDRQGPEAGQEGESEARGQAHR